MTPITLLRDPDQDPDGDDVYGKPDELSLDGIVINPEDPGSSYLASDAYSIIDLADQDTGKGIGIRSGRQKRKKKRTKGQKVKKFLGITLMVIIIVGLASAMMSIFRRK